MEINSQRFTRLGIHVWGGNEANAPGAEGFAHKPGQPRDEEPDDFYGVSFGEAQLIPRCSSVVLDGKAPAFDWETKVKKGILVGSLLKPPHWKGPGHDSSWRGLPVSPLRFIVSLDPDLCHFSLRSGL